MNKLATGLVSLFIISLAQAETMDLPQAIDRALNSDPRISEMESYVNYAKALKQEAEGSDDMTLTSNTFLGFSPGVDGGFFKSDNCGSAEICQLRVDRYKLNDGISPWFYMEFGIIKPLNTFGKVENYTEAAEKNIQLKQQDVRLQRGSAIYDVKRAYYGYLAAKDTHLFLDDVVKRIDSALETVQSELDEESGKHSKSELYALQSASGLAKSYVNKATALEQIAIQGVKVLTGLGLDEPLELADKSLAPVELPATTLEELTKKAMEKRPEVLQIESGLEARKALVQAKQSMKRPNIYAGFVGSVSYSPLRDRVDNPHIYDPFNDFGATPIVGVQWSWEGGVQNARVQQAQAEYSALLEKNRFAQRGIPYQVSEAFAQVNAHYQAVQQLKTSAMAARRWMISRYTEFEAGLEPVDKLINAFQAYVLSYSNYLQTAYDYNMQVAQLEKVIGDYE